MKDSVPRATASNPVFLKTCAINLKVEKIKFRLIFHRLSEKLDWIFLHWIEYFYSLERDLRFNNIMHTPISVIIILLFFFYFSHFSYDS